MTTPPERPRYGQEDSPTPKRIYRGKNQKNTSSDKNNLSSANVRFRVPLIKNFVYGLTESLCLRSRLHNIHIAPLRTRVHQPAPPPPAPSTRGGAIPATMEDIPIDHVKDRTIFFELPCKSGPAFDHLLVVRGVEEMGLHFRWGVPDEVSQVGVDGRVFEFWGITDNGLEVDFLGQDNVGGVHEKGSWEIVPPKDTEFEEGST